MLTVKEVLLQRSEGEVIPHLEGRIVHVGKYKPLTSTTGEHCSTQTIDICDLAHPKAKISVRLEDFNEVTEKEKGMTAVLQAHELTAGGFLGVVLETNPIYVLNDPTEALAVATGKKGKKNSLILVARKLQKATFHVDDGSAKAAAPQNTPANAPESPETHPKPEPIRPYYRESELAEQSNVDRAHAARVSAVAAMETQIKQYMNIHRMAMAAADQLEKERKEAGLTYSPEHHNSQGMSIFIAVTSSRSQPPANFPVRNWREYQKNAPKPATDKAQEEKQ